jgi:hypothetical protein
MRLTGVRPPSILVLVCGVVQFSRTRKARVGISDHKIEGQLADAIEDPVAMVPALEPQLLQKLDLGPYLVVGQRFY